MIAGRRDRHHVDRRRAIRGLGQERLGQRRDGGRGGHAVPHVELLHRVAGARHRSAQLDIAVDRSALAGIDQKRDRPDPRAAEHRGKIVGDDHPVQRLVPFGIGGKARIVGQHRAFHQGIAARMVDIDQGAVA